MNYGSDPYVWTPDAATLRDANVTRLMKACGVRTFDELSRRSRNDIEWFWAAADRDLGLEWFRPYSRVLDLSRGPMHARWFQDGLINIAHNAVDRHAARRPDKAALVWEGEEGSVRRFTFSDLARQVSRAAFSFRSLGLGKGDVMGLYMPMVPEAVISFLAAAKLGAIVTPIFSGYAAGAVASRVADCSAKLLVTADGFRRRGAVVPLKTQADEARKLVPSVRHTVVFRRLGIDVPWDEVRDRDGAKMMASAPDALESERTGAEDPFLVIHTSGTTGKPKGAVHVHGGFLVKVAAEVAYQTDLKDEDTLFWVTDMGWIMAPWEIVGGLALGGTIFAYEGAPDYPSADRIWSMVERHRISILGVSPTLVRALAKHPTELVTRHDLGSLRILGSTGEPWNPEPYLWLFRVVGRERCPIINLSGGTEVGACFLSAHPVVPLKTCSLGGPALGMDVDVWDERGRPVRGGVGELVCRKPWPGMTRGLWNDPERYLETYWSRWPGTWVHGDWASIDGDGSWFLHGRSDDTIKVAGKRVGPAEIESALAGHPAVVESAAIGAPDETKGEAVVVFVVLRPGATPGAELGRELGARVARELGKPLAPREVKFVGALPRTRNAKILRRLIRAAYLREPVGDVANLENPEALDEIRRAV